MMNFRINEFGDAFFKKQILKKNSSQSNTSFSFQQNVGYEIVSNNTSARDINVRIPYVPKGAWTLAFDLDTSKTTELWLTVTSDDFKNSNSSRKIENTAELIPIELNFDTNSWDYTGIQVQFKLKGTCHIKTGLQLEKTNIFNAAKTLGLPRFFDYSTMPISIS